MFTASESTAAADTSSITLPRLACVGSAPLRSITIAGLDRPLSLLATVDLVEGLQGLTSGVCNFAWLTIRCPLKHGPGIVGADAGEDVDKCQGRFNLERFADESDRPIARLDEEDTGDRLVVLVAMTYRTD